MDREELMTVEEVASAANMTVWGVYAAIKAGHLPTALKFGRTVIKRSDVARWLADREAHRRGPKKKN